MLLAHNVHRVAHRRTTVRHSDAHKRPDIIRLTNVPVLAYEMQFAKGDRGAI
jgi:hypothetical protein